VTRAERGSDLYAGSVTSKLLSAAAALLLALSLTACAPEPAPSPTGTVPSASSTDPAGVTDGPCADVTGVTVTVDPGALASAEAPAIEKCVPAEGPVGAAEAFERAGVSTEGTVEYGDQVVCRVNGVPGEDQPLPNPDGSEYLEECAAMPAAFAYWSLWLKPADGEWNYAPEGLSTLQLNPGESVELLFTLNGEPAAPVS